MSGLCPRCDHDSPLGVEIPGVYDGVLFWRCAFCGAAWERAGHTGRRAEVARSYVFQINQAVMTALEEDWMGVPGKGASGA